MRNFIRALSLVLALLMMMSCFIACKDNGDDPKDTDKNTADTVDGETKKLTSLPDEDWGGEVFRVLGRSSNSAASIFDNFEIMRDELPEDVVGKAIYNRNATLFTDYNFKVEQRLVETVANEAKTYLESGDDMYNLIIYRPTRVQSHAQSGYLLNLAEELEYIDLSNSSWNQYVNEQLTMGGKLFYTTSDFLLQDKHRTQFIFYNRDLASQLNLGYFEDFVDNNTWTLETMGQIAKAASADNDGVSGNTEFDRFGLGMEDAGLFGCLAFSAGFRLSDKGTNGYPKLVGATEKMLNILDAVLEITGDSSTTFYMQGRGLQNAHEHLFNHFLEGRILMMLEFTSFYDEFIYDAEFPIGVLPDPKYEATQENYCTSPNLENGSLFAVPYTVSDTEFTGFCLQALTEASTETSYKAYIETKCKYQDAYDEDCARMLDLCFKGVVYDVAACGNWGELYNFVAWETQNNGKNNYKRIFDAKGGAAKKAINKLIEDYAKM